MIDIDKLIKKREETHRKLTDEIKNARIKNRAEAVKTKYNSGSVKEHDEIRELQKVIKSLRLLIIEMLEKEGKTKKEISLTLGISTTRIKQIRS